MQVILDSLFARLGLTPTTGASKREFRDWTTGRGVGSAQEKIVNISIL